VIASEAMRFRSRRLVKWMTLLFVLGLAFAGFLVFINSEAEGPSTVSAEAIESSFIYQDCISNVEPQPGESIEEFCFEIAQQESIGQDERFFFSDMHEIFIGVTVPIAMLAFFLGASFMGAEWQKGTMTTTLTWENRRWAVFAAKAVVVIIASLALFLVLQALLTLFLMPSALFRGTTEGLDAAWWQDAGATLARCAALTVVAGVLGMSVASLGRNTAAALGVGFGYIVVVENLIRALKPQWEQWLVTDNSAVFVTGDPSLFASASDGVSQLSGHSANAAGLLVLAYAALVVALAYGFFRSRDVT
jgi:ABC-type transport system involved in multi-copper enzyme maturation permease subunit